MPNINLNLPVIIQPVSIKGENMYEVKPVFLPSLNFTARRYAEAINQLRALIKRHFQGFIFQRNNADELLWFKMGQEVKLSNYNLAFNLGSHRIEGRFCVVSFDWQGLSYACLPDMNHLMFIVPPDEKGKTNLRAATEEIVREIMRTTAQSEGKNFNPGQYYSHKRASLTSIQLTISVKDPGFYFEKTTPPFLQTAVRVENWFNGEEEIEAVAEVLNSKYPNALRRAYYRESLVHQIQDLIFNRSNTPLVLVGREGVGKHTLVEEVTWRYMNNPLQQGRRQLIWHLNPNRVIAGMSIVGHWEKRFEAILQFVQRPDEQVDLSDIILVDNAVALLRIGKTAGSELTLSHILKIYLEKRKLPFILIATPEEWKIIQETDRSFSDLFQVIRVPEPDLPTTLKIILQNRRTTELQHECSITVPAISQLVTIQRNYLKNKALPGSIMKLMIQLATKYRRQVVDAPEVREEFKNFSGLQERIFDEHTRLEKEDVTEILQQELVGQPMALEALTNVIHLVKAKLTDRHKPLASLLFIGPTGVGKTHAAKILCKVMLGNEDQLLRFDMNEYIDGGALHRLIGNQGNPEGQLTGKVRYRPFSVILLDEIEKAHPNIHDLLLQMLDDARLTDSMGRMVDFSNTVIVMTSNLGAKEVSQQLGFQTASKNDSAIYRKSVENFFRPELVNRIEQIVIFNSLEFKEIQKIAQLQIRELLQRDGFVRRTTIVNVAPEALDWVATRGFDARMGGRALKRQIEKDLTLLSAEQLIRTTADTPVILDILLEDGHLVPHITTLNFVSPLGEAWLPPLPEDQSVSRFFNYLLIRLSKLERTVISFENKQEKKGEKRQVSGDGYEWKHHDFKNRIFVLKDAIRFKQLSGKKRNPVLPFRFKRVLPNQFNQAGDEPGNEWMQDRFFQPEIRSALREEFRHSGFQFDSIQTDYLVSLLDLIFLEIMLEGFLEERTEKVTLQFEACVTITGQKEIDFLMQFYIRLLTHLDIQFQVDEEQHTIRAEEYNLYRLLSGEAGIHLFYPAHNIPSPVKLTLMHDGMEPGLATSSVIRIYDNLETVNDLRTGFSNQTNLTPDESKLLLYGGICNTLSVESFAKSQEAEKG
jgi:ATP-dependent Clp protease ATP-binding subunit ClpC